MGEERTDHLKEARIALSAERDGLRRVELAKAHALIALVEEIEALRIDVQNVRVALRNMQPGRGRVN